MFMMFCGDPVGAPVSFFLCVCVVLLHRVLYLSAFYFLFWDLSKPKIKPTKRDQNGIKRNNHAARH